MNLVNFGGTEFRNCCYTGVWWIFKPPHFHDLKSCTGKRDQRLILRQKAVEILAKKNALCYFVLLSERPDAMLPLSVVCSLIFIVESLSWIKFDLYIEHKVKK